MERARADFDIDGLFDHAASVCPELAEREDEVLQVHGRVGPYRRQVDRSSTPP
jgi:hypothetical protein